MKIADDFKAIRERRNELGGKDIIKEYVTPTSERELTRVEKLLTACPPGTVHLGTITAGTHFGIEDLQKMWNALADTLMRQRSPPIMPVRYVGKSPLLTAPYGEKE